MTFNRSNNLHCAVREAASESLFSTGIKGHLGKFGHETLQWREQQFNLGRATAPPPPSTRLLPARRRL
jgi:hypothetical protein